MSISIIPAMNAKDAKPPVVNVEPAVVNVAGGVTEMDLLIEYVAKYYGTNKDNIKVRYADGQVYFMNLSEGLVKKVLTACNSDGAPYTGVGSVTTLDGTASFALKDISNLNVQPVTASPLFSGVYFELLVFEKINPDI